MHMGRRQVPDWLVVPFLGSGLSDGAVGSGSQDRAGTIYRLCPEPERRPREDRAMLEHQPIREERWTQAVIRK